MDIILLLFLQVDSISLEQAIDIALHQGPIYLESRESLAKTRIQFYQALSQLLPTTTTTGAWTHSEFNNMETDAYSGSINFSIPIFDLDVISAIALGAGQARSSAIQHKQETANLVLSIKKSYYNLLTATELLNSSNKAIERAMENKKLVETKFNLGSASRLELLQAEVYYLQALQSNSQARTLETQAQQELRTLLNIENNIYPTDSLIMPDTFVLPSLDSLKGILVKANLSIRLAREVEILGKTNFLFATLAFLPKVSFFYGYNTTVDSFAFDFDYLKDNAKKNYGVNISFPIFEIKTLIFNYLVAKKEKRIKELSKQRAILESEKALYTSYYSLQEAIDKLNLAQKGYEVAEEAVTLTREQYTLGMISIMDLLQTEEEFYNARVNLIQALNDYYIQQSTISYLLGITIFEETE